MQKLPIDVEWVNDSLYWTGPNYSFGEADLRKVNPDGGYNPIVARVRKKDDGYEASVARHKASSWILGILPSVAEAKDAILAALTIQRMEH